MDVGCPPPGSPANFEANRSHESLPRLSSHVSARPDDSGVRGSIPLQAWRLLRFPPLSMQVRALAQATPPPDPSSLDEQHCMDVLSLVKQCAACADQAYCGGIAVGPGVSLGDVMGPLASPEVNSMGAGVLLSVFLHQGGFLGDRRGATSFLRCSFGTSGRKYETPDAFRRVEAKKRSGSMGSVTYSLLTLWSRHR